VMPYAEGESLRERLDRERQLPIPEAVAITREVASALDYAHRHGVVHRDIKPENILLVDGEAVVADFGIALALGAAGGGRLTEHGVSVGTPRYMSPEQATGEAVDGRADVYALSCVLYEMLAGQTPYSDVTLQALVARLLTDHPVHPRLLRDTIPEELDRTIMTALAKVPADRFPTAEAFSEALAAAVTTAPTVGRRPGPAAMALGVAASVALGVAAYVALAGGPPAAVPVRNERQLTFEGTVQGVALAPDGDFFSYFTGDGGYTRLFVKEVGGGNAVMIDSVAGLMCCVAWSPDGTRIAYQRGPRSNGTTVIVPRLGGPRRPVRAEIALAWSPDGSRLLSWWPAARELTLTDVAAASITGTVPLGDEHDWVDGADWSPDGSLVAVALQDSLAYRIRTLELDGRVVDDLVVDTAATTSPVWADDGSGIYYRRYADIWKVPVSRGGRRAGEPTALLTAAPASVLNVIVPSFAVSANGERLAYNRFEGYANLWRFSDWDGEGGEPASREQLTRGTTRPATPRFSPDGSSIAYTEEREGAVNLFVLPAEGGAPRQLTFFDRGIRSPTWSPDGSTIAVAGLEGRDAGLWLVDVEGGALTRAPLESFDADELLWAGRAGLIYQASDHSELRALDPETWEERVLWPTQAGTWWYDLRSADDGRGLLLRRTGDFTGLWRLELPTGAVRLLTGEPGAAIGAGPSGVDVLAMRIDGRGDVAREIFRLAADGTGFLPYLALPLGQSVNSLHVTLSPDRRTLVAAVPVSTTDVWLVENFDPR